MKMLNTIIEVASRKLQKMIERIPSKVKDNIIVAWFLAKCTSTVVLIALFVLCPVLAYPFLLGWPAPYCYVAYALWISLLIGSLVGAAIVGYLKEMQGERRR